MRFQGALIREQGVNFGVVIVKQYVINNRTEADKAIQEFMPAFGGVPVVLMAQDSSGKPTYFGRPDLAKFLANRPLTAIPWRELTIN